MLKIVVTLTMTVCAGGGLGGSRIGAPNQNIKPSGRFDSNPHVSYEDPDRKFTWDIGNAWFNVHSRRPRARSR